MTKRYTGGVVSSSLPTVNAAGASGVFNLSQQADAQAKNNWPPFKVEKSLRFRASNSAYLSRTPAVAGNRTTWTYSSWVKRGSLSSSYQRLMTATIGSDEHILFRESPADVFHYYSGNAGIDLVTNQVFRDPSAWYHMVVAVDTTQATSSNRAKIYVNGVRVTSFGTETYPSQNALTGINSVIAHGIGGADYSQYFDGHMAEVNFVDGLQLTPSSFGGTDKDGNWSPIAYTGAYGQNGFYLNFKDATSTSTLGYDYSGNSNNWTPNNLSVTAGITYDSMIDVPSDQAGANTRGNFCTLNPLNKYSGTTVSAGNMKVTHGSSGDGWCTTGSTWAFPETGKWYAEFFITSRAFSGTVMIGISEANRSFVSQSGDTARYSWGRGYFDNASTFIGPSSGTTGTVTNYTTNDTIMLAFDSDNGKVWWGKNGTWYGTGASPDPATGTSAAYTGLTRAAYPMGFVATCEGYSGSVTDANFGQRPFSYTPPTGFKSLNTFNLPEPTIKQPNKHFDINLWTGNGGTQVITNSGSMQPGMIWIKTRNQANYHCLQDIVRGTDGTLFPNATAAEETNQPRLSSFNSNGFTLTSKNDANGSGDTFVGWQWNAGTANVTNTSGSVTSLVRNNPIAGFSVVTYNTGSAGTQTVGHGLGVTPAMIWIKSRISSSAHWDVWHKSFANPAQGYMYLNLLNAVANDARNYSNTAPTSSLFTFESGYEFTANQNYVAYFWAEIDGYSRFSNYVGNGSTDGPFVYTGFRPKFIMMKNSTTGGTSRNWAIIDSTRSYANAGNHTLAANLADASSSFGSGVDVFGASNVIDILSNGFKIRDTGSFANTSGDTYIFMAFAEVPFKYSRSR